ncbi:RCC1-like G exchanging factor-like protein [Patiria miniata]|uniref:RCC1-like domain-containing protein n=1 Tax=Patiria miniata TaxID=46514 RepID=A0A913ZM15_PATMI|nr:RCC1-like G exchanging factor-like protein [Patiria miniata]XP_038052105.1 RCC1-like G exchanging factor-like protein [Patiria miniata]XP_038052106.1 RCC1-like G exchanging factor-like protein [Patiria miniata]XP_038052107.1 RCC1-like G exchanging factor-like protein [Patiria miniata]
MSACQFVKFWQTWQTAPKVSVKKFLGSLKPIQHVFAARTGSCKLYVTNYVTKIPCRKSLVNYGCRTAVTAIRTTPSCNFSTSAVSSSKISTPSSLPPSSEAQRRQEEASDMATTQLVGKHRRRQDRVYVWGLSYTGALGIPSFVKPKQKGKDRKPRRKYQSSPYLLQQNEKITSIACGYGFTLLASNTLQTTKVWGTGINTDSQLGFQPRSIEKEEGMDYILAPVPIDLPLTRPRATRVAQVSCGRAHSLILTDNEGVFSLGNNAHGQCGRTIIETENYRSNAVIHNIKGIEGTVTQVECGHDHSLFLTEEGAVYSCGWGADGQTGLGHYESVDHPVPLEGDIKGEKIIKISTFADCCLAVSEKGDIFGWGNSEYNQLNSVTEEMQVYEPRRLPFSGVGKVVGAAAGGTICQLVNDAGDVFVWGYGILGKGPKLSESKYPEHVPAILFGQTKLKRDVMVTQVHCGLHHFAAVTNHGDLYTWGTNDSGHLGLASLQNQFFPLRVCMAAEVKTVACGVDHTVALCKTFV